jgi:hypothetical protein
MNDDKILEHINNYSATTLKQIQAIPEVHLTKIVAGNLRSTIDAHGDITKHHIGSAAKRIANHLLGVTK